MRSKWRSAKAPVLAPLSIHTTPCVSRHPPVVVMQATDDRECHDTTVSLGHSRQRLFLPEALVWPRLVVKAGVLRDEAQKMAFAKHEDMVEQFAPESADKALGEGVHVRGPDRGANDLGADSFERAREPSTQVGVAIDDKHFGLDVQGCVSRLLRTPVIGRRPGDCSVHDSPSLQIEKEQDKDWRKSTSKVCTKSQAQVTWLRRKVLQRWPSPGTPFFMYRCTVRLRDPDSKLEQLTSKPLGAPPWVSRRHLADQHRVACRPSAARSPARPPNDSLEYRARNARQDRDPSLATVPGSFLGGPLRLSSSTECRDSWHGCGACPSRALSTRGARRASSSWTGRTCVETSAPPARS